MAQNWVSIPQDAAHPLARLQGRSLGAFWLHLLWGPTSPVGARYFKIFLRKGKEHLSQEPVVLGLAGIGPYPGYNWIEILDFQSSLSLEGSEERVDLDLREGGLGHQLVVILAELIPAGGHMMVEYESPQWRDTERSLALGIPPAATPLGYLLFSAGCGMSFKDWHISEGGKEGPRKLQGFKPLMEKDARQKTQKLANGLLAFLSRPTDPNRKDLEEGGRGRAMAVLEALRAEGLLKSL